MLSDDLQKALDAAFVAARMEGHDLLTVEHLLLALRHADFRSPDRRRLRHGAA